MSVDREAASIVCILSGWGGDEMPYRNLIIASDDANNRNRSDSSPDFVKAMYQLVDRGVIDWRNGIVSLTDLGKIEANIVYGMDWIWP